MATGAWKPGRCRPTRCSRASATRVGAGAVHTQVTENPEALLQLVEGLTCGPAAR